MILALVHHVVLLRELKLLLSTRIESNILTTACFFPPIHATYLSHKAPKIRWFSSFLSVTVGNKFKSGSLKDSKYSVYRNVR